MYNAEQKLFQKERIATHSQQVKELGKVHREVSVSLFVTLQKASKEGEGWRLGHQAVWATLMDILVSAHPRCVCGCISQPMYAPKCFIRFTKMVSQIYIFFKIQFYFLFLSKPRRFEAVWQEASGVSGHVSAEIHWHISAKHFGFLAALLGSSDQVLPACFPYHFPRKLSSMWQYRGNTYSFWLRERSLPRPWEKAGPKT